MNRRSMLWGGCLLLGCIFSMIASLKTGPFEISYLEIRDFLMGKPVPHADILYIFRLPRTLIALATGAILTLSGFYMQVLIRNPLADPYIMGVTAGAGLGVNLLILNIITIPVITTLTYPLFAGLGGLASLLLVVMIGARGLSDDNSKLLIAGVAVSSICTALIGLLIYLYADSDQVRRVVFWTFGSLSRAQKWEAVGVGGAMWIVSLAFGWIYGIHLDILSLGDEQAQHLGMRVFRMKLIILVIATISVGGIVAFTGPIGFVGMMIPHFSRSLLGSIHRHNLLIASLLGAMYLNTCDVLSRWILPPAGVPIGIITALLGVPFFLYILFSDKKYF